MNTTERPRILSGYTYEIKTSCGNLFITCNTYEDHLFEVFVKLGKAGGCASAFTEAIGKLVSNSLRSGIDPNEMIKSLTGIKCNHSEKEGFSCVSSIGEVIQEHLKKENK